MLCYDRLSKSETVKRKLHALTLLLLVIQKSGPLLRSTAGGAFLLRRVLCPTLITTCVTDIPSIFRLIIQIFLELWQNHNDSLMVCVVSVCRMRCKPYGSLTMACVV
jgi:hypothetical protein